MLDVGHISVVSTAKKDHVVPVTLLSADQDGPTNVLRLQPKGFFFLSFLNNVMDICLLSHVQIAVINIYIKPNDFACK